MLVPLPAHTDYQMRHRESIQHEAKEGGDGCANGYDPEGGQERKRLGCKAFAGGGDEGRDGIPFCEQASKTACLRRINNRR